MAKKRRVRHVKKKSAKAATKKQKRRHGARRAVAKALSKGKPSRKETIAKTLPDPVKGKFLITAEVGPMPESTDPVTGEVIQAATERRLMALTVDNEWAAPSSASKIFPTKEAAQTVVDEALVMADETSLWRSAEVESATKHLAVDYRFGGLSDEHLLHVGVLPRAELPDAMTFNQAKSFQHRILKAQAAKAAKELQRFEKTWG